MNTCEQGFKTYGVEFVALDPGFYRSDLLAFWVCYLRLHDVIAHLGNNALQNVWMV